jgi:hypothetical protein
MHIRGGPLHNLGKRILGQAPREAFIARRQMRACAAVGDNCRKSRAKQKGRRWNYDIPHDRGHLMKVRQPTDTHAVG